MGRPTKKMESSKKKNVEKISSKTYVLNCFLASELNNIKPTPNQEAELKDILNLIKQEKKNWFIARFLHSGGHLQDSNWNIKRDGILKKAGVWRNQIDSYMRETEGKVSEIEREKRVLFSTMLEMSK